jgi:hypothetical protein
MAPRVRHDGGRDGGGPGGLRSAARRADAAGPATGVGRQPAAATPSASAATPRTVGGVPAGSNTYGTRWACHPRPRSPSTGRGEGPEPGFETGQRSAVSNGIPHHVRAGRLEPRRRVVQTDASTIRAATVAAARIACSRTGRPSSSAATWPNRDDAPRRARRSRPQCAIARGGIAAPAPRAGPEPRDGPGAGRTRVRAPEQPRRSGPRGRQHVLVPVASR